jgi:hypothetical protein
MRERMREWARTKEWEGQGIGKDEGMGEDKKGIAVRREA